jgi:lysophospholipase L1-like esterase
VSALPVNSLARTLPLANRGGPMSDSRILAGVLLFAAAMAGPAAMVSEGAEVAYEASPRSDQNSMLAHEQLLQKKSRGQIDIFFVGDSITRRWGASDAQYAYLLANWKQNFTGWNAGNFGWGADLTQNILWRLQNGELDGIHPKVIVLMAGTNNVGKLSPTGADDPRVEDVTRGLRAILDLCREKAPEATIVITGITPRNDNPEVMPLITRINANVAKFADGRQVRFIDLNPKLADPKGKLYDGMTDPDRLHLAVNAYQIWADALKPIFTEVLGPPASVDRAPPPTGDPSAVR